MPVDDFSAIPHWHACFDGDLLWPGSPNNRRLDLMAPLEEQRQSQRAHVIHLVAAPRLQPR